MGKCLHLVGLLLVNTLACSVYSIVAPYLPDEAKEKGLSSLVTGLILSGYAITALISSFILGKHISSLGKERVLRIGCFLEAFSTIGFSTLPSLSPILFILLGFTFRLMQGLGAGCISVAILAIFASEYKENLQESLGLLQVTNAVGFLIGPLGSSGLYALGGFSVIFLTYGLIFLTILGLLCFIPHSPERDLSKTGTIPIRKIIKDSEIAMYTLVMFAASTCLCFISPTLSIHLMTFGVKEEFFGAIFAIPTISFAFTIMLIQKATISKQNIISIGVVLLIAGNLLIGPWNLPHYLPITLLGLIVIGSGLSACNIIAFPMIVELSQKKFEEIDGEVVSDIISGLANTVTFFAEIYAPPLSGYLKDLCGFENTQALVAGVLVILLVGVRSVAGKQVKIMKKREDIEMLFVEESLKSSLVD